MADPTKPIQFGADWVQVTNGTNYGIIQAGLGSLKYTISATKPAAGAPSYPVDSSGLSVNPPLSVWVKAAGKDVVTASVTTYS